MNQDADELRSYTLAKQVIASLVRSVKHYFQAHEQADHVEQCQEILVNLAQAYKAGKNVDKAKEAYAQAQKIDPAMASKYKALGLELMNTLSPTRARPAAPAGAREKK